MKLTNVICLIQNYIFLEQELMLKIEINVLKKLQYNENKKEHNIITYFTK